MTSLENKITEARISIESETLKEMSLKSMEDIANFDNRYLLPNCTGTALEDAYKKRGDIYAIEGKFIQVVEIKILTQTMDRACVQVTIETKHIDNITLYKMFTYVKVDGLWKISAIGLDA